MSLLFLYRSVVVASTTWDAANKSTFITLSSGNAVATGTIAVGAPQPVIATAAKTTGKHYFEVHVTLPAAFNGPGVGGGIEFAIRSAL